jgi:heptosyltransferase-1
MSDAAPFTAAGQTIRRVLVVKTSSMGDVVHTLPAVSDMRAHCPGIEVDWLVERPFAALPELHPGVRQVLPMAWRKWRRQLGQRQTWQAMAALRSQLRERQYQLVIDFQGLFKSAIWARQAAAPVAGYNRRSAREGGASWLYRHPLEVPTHLHAIERSRRLAALALGYPMPATPPAFGVRAGAGSWPVPQRRAVLIPCASRPEKFWPLEGWRAVRSRCEAAGLQCVILWGNELELRNAQAIAQGSDSLIPPFLSVAETAAVLDGAELVVGLDTGFTHLGAALQAPTLGIYCDHEPGLTGVTGGPWVRSLGAKGRPPAQSEVMPVLEGLLQWAAANRPSKAAPGEAPPADQA